MNLEKMHESISLPCNIVLEVDIVAEPQFMCLAHMRPNKWKHWSLEQRKVYFRTKQGEMVAYGPKAQTPQCFSGKIFL